ncbi:MAG TPA: sulfate transporter family protein [Tianweitania sediminis]|jgi:CysZ protein|nr:sulfate transporter family protein [Tianweitania sediminis]
MIIDSARAAAGHLFSAAFRSVLFKSLGLSILVLIALWFGLTSLFDWLALPFVDDVLASQPQTASWISFLAAVAAGLLIAVGLALLIAPVTALIAGLFLDDVAERVERIDFPDEPAGRAMPTLPAIWLSIKFFGIVILGNLLAFALLVIPGVNLIAFFVVNAYLLSREFFEFAAMRYRSETEAKALRRKHAASVFTGGLVIAGFLAVPLLNLLTPLFAAALMVHLHKRISQRERYSA